MKELTQEPYKVTLSDPAAINSICTYHAPKYIPKVIAGHAFLSFGSQKGDPTRFLQLLARANFGAKLKIRVNALNPIHFYLEHSQRSRM